MLSDRTISATAMKAAKTRQKWLNAIFYCNLSGRDKLLLIFIKTMPKQI